MEDIENYKFIALVKIDSIYFLKEDTLNSRPTHHIDISILDLYRGVSVNTIQVSGSNHNLNTWRWTSCDMDINPGEEWVLFAYLLPDSTLQTGLCTFSQKYKNIDGQRDWLFERGFKRIQKVKQLLQLTDSSSKIKNGKHIESYPQGSVELEAQYKNGKLEGERKIWYTDGQIMSIENFKSGLKEGRSIWYNPNGSILRTCNYKDGHESGACIVYYKENTILRESNYSESGVLLISSHFDINGILIDTYETVPLRNESISTYYYESGEVKERSISKIGEVTENTTAYFKNGGIKATWQYFNEGPLKQEYKQYDENGSLIDHKQVNRNHETIWLKKSRPD
ncbi:toxin-antitoxin system YwqK family antitoxin [Jiulongibacter sp. NS-SX5]|uniref:toxin-antitoxin system YwqK family antitoxin n=1 Tax=Jiulongibacter sp. NS-SX5 TaxID=3463854 RepID=UPI0040587EA0